MNRRGFLASILGGLAVATYRPDLLFGRERIVLAGSVPDQVAATSLLQTANEMARKYFTPLVPEQIFEPMTWQWASMEIRC